MYINLLKVLFITVLFLINNAETAHAQTNNVLTYYNLLAKAKPNACHYVFKMKNGVWITNSRFDKNKNIQPTVDIKNGFIQIKEPMAQGDEIVQIALFTTDDKQAFICINVYGSCGDPYGSICQNSIEFYAYDDNEWMNVTKSVLPVVVYKLFFNEKFYASKIKNNRALYDMLRHMYELPRMGTSITVRIITTGIEGSLDDGVSSDVDAGLLKELLANIKRREIFFTWNMKKGLFEQGQQR